MSEESLIILHSDVICKASCVRLIMPDSVIAFILLPFALSASGRHLCCSLHLFGLLMFLSSFWGNSLLKGTSKVSLVLNLTLWLLFFLQCIRTGRCSYPHTSTLQFHFQTHTALFCSTRVGNDCTCSICCLLFPTGLSMERSVSLNKCCEVCRWH